MNEVVLSWQDIEKAVDSIVNSIGPKQYDFVVGIANGGLIPATLIAKKLKKRTLSIGVSSYKDKEREDIDWWAGLNDMDNYKKDYSYLLVDDISDSGSTLKYLFNEILDESVDTATLVIKPHTKFFPTYHAITVESSRWVKFPWE